jgi:hypothetical protein
MAATTRNTNNPSPKLSEIVIEFNGKNQSISTLLSVTVQTTLNYNHEQYRNKTHFSLQHTTLEDSVSPAILLINPHYDSRSASHLDYTKRAQLAELLVVHVGGSIGLSTRREIGYARQQGKRVQWLESGVWR